MKKALIIAVLICLLSVGLLACEEEKIKVADVTGMDAQEASDLLKESGFTLSHYPQIRPVRAP